MASQWRKCSFTGISREVTTPIFIYLYYKKWRQLKTFLTQFGPVRLRDDKKGGTTIKIAIWGAFLPKTYFLSPTLHLPTLHTHWAHFSFSIPFPVTAHHRLESVPCNSVCAGSLFGVRSRVRVRHLVRRARVAASNPGYGVRDKHQEGQS
jgi:hypothetical protein